MPEQNQNSRHKQTFKIAAKLDLCDFLTLKNFKMLKCDCILLFSWTIPTLWRINRPNRTTLTFDSFFNRIFEDYKIEGQHEGRPILSINTSYWRACQDKLTHKFDFHFFKVNSKVKSLQGPPIYFFSPFVSLFIWAPLLSTNCQNHV